MHIVIVGGGTAGWLTALIGLARTPHEFTVIESLERGIIGVGESTTGFFTDLFSADLQGLGIDHKDFMIKTGATCKLGIRHRDWHRPGSSYFGPLDGSATQFDSPDLQFQWALRSLPRDQQIKISHTGYLIAQGLSNMDSQGQFTSHGHSLHIDGQLTSRYFRERAVLNPRCHWQDQEVQGLVRDSGGRITALKLRGDQQITADLVIDCTGFARSIITEMGAQWQSYRPWLPVDRGMPFLENYAEGELPEAWTTAWAQKHGWMWTTPLMGRRGNGYVFSSDHLTDEQAQREIELALGRAIQPVKFIKFEAGRQDRAWIDNCVSIGLSSSFLEPLEATSIHTTICQIKMLFTEYLSDRVEDLVNPGTQATFNRRWAQQLDDLRDFLVMHYQGGRRDSEFWRYISSGATRSDRVQELLDMARSRVPTLNDFPRYWGVAGWSLYGWVMAGLGLLDSAEINHTMDQQIDLATGYQLQQQEFHRRYGRNLSHRDYILHMRNLSN